MATAVKYPAISYTRFSDPKQQPGSSQERQDDDFRDFCLRFNLVPQPEVFADKGRSGYTDAHRKKGKLGQLIALAKEPGRFEPGTVIVVEAWDRLGRLRPDKQVDLIAELLRTSVRIGICRLNDIFEEADFGTHKWTILATFAQLAYQESKQKADRIAKDWAKRRERAQAEGAFVLSKKGKAGILPAWLRTVNGKVVPIPERKATLQRLYRLSADGMGEARIARAFNDPKDGEAPFGKGKWSKNYVRKLLRDRRAVGEFQPRRLNDERQLVPDGPAIPNYFPRVVSDDLFNLAQGAQNGRKTKGGAATKDRKHVNAFAGLLTHARDGGGFVLTNPRTAAKPHLLLTSSAGRNGKGGISTFPYLVFEEAILSCLQEVDPKDVLPKAPASRADVLKAKLGNLRDEVRQLKEELRAGFSKSIAAVLREQEEAEAKVAGELQEELARTARPVEQAWQEVHKLADMVREGGDEVRLKLRPALRRAVERTYVLTIRMGYRLLCVAQVRFGGGEQREYAVLYSPANKSSAGWYRVASLRSPFGVFDPDSPAVLGVMPIDLGALGGVERAEQFLSDDGHVEAVFADSPKQPLP